MTDAQPDRQHVGVFGSVPESAYAQGERNVAGNLLERPGAATRGFIQGMMPGGPSPVEGYVQGAVNPGAIPRFQDLASQAVGRQFSPERFQGPGMFNQLNRGFLNSPVGQQYQAGVGTAASVGGMVADTLTNPAEMLLSLVGATKPIQAGVASLAKSPLGKGVSRVANTPVGMPRLGRPPIETVEQVLQVPEARLPKLTQRERQAYFSARSEQIAQATFQQQQALKVERNQLSKELGKTAQQRSLYVRQQLPALYTKQSRHYRALVDQELAPVANDLVTDTELRGFLTQRFANDLERLNEVSARMGLLNEISPDPALPPPTFKLGELYQKTLDFGQTLPKAVRESLRVQSVADNITDDTIATLVDFLDTKGVSLRNARSFWKDWAPIRNQATQEVRPFLGPDIKTRAGSQRLIAQAKGMDPDNTVYSQTLANLLGIDSLPGEVSGVVRKLNTNQKAGLALTLQQEEASGALRNMQFQVGQRADRRMQKLRVVKWVLGLLGGGVAAGGMTAAMRQ